MSALEEGDGATHVKRGRKLGDTRAVVARPEARYFRLGAEGTIVAKAAAIEPQRRVARLGFGARRFAFGRVLSSHEELEQRLPKWKALAVFSSDVMSSVAYATEASMFTLLALGTVAFSYLMPISFLIVGLLFLVTFSYRQTIRAYPQGGGSYIVARQNLGVDPGAHRRGRAPHRLCPHRVRQRVGRRVQPRVRVPRPPGRHRPAHRRRDPAGDGGQPAGHEGERDDLRPAHLHLHRQRPGARGRRPRADGHGPPAAGHRRRGHQGPRREPSACCS